MQNTHVQKFIPYGNTKKGTLRKKRARCSTKERKLKVKTYTQLYLTRREVERVIDIQRGQVCRRSHVLACIVRLGMRCRSEQVFHILNTRKIGSAKDLDSFT